MSQRSLRGFVQLYQYGGNDMAETHKTDLKAENGPRARRAYKEGATFDNELQRYVMPSNLPLP